MPALANALQPNESGFKEKPFPARCLLPRVLRMRPKQTMNLSSRHANFTIALNHATP
jgi:hypothetical protein